MCYPTLFTGCQNSDTEPKTTFPPQTLSEWQVLRISDDFLEIINTKSTQSYIPNSALFSDYALKFRTLTLPTGQEAPFKEISLDLAEGNQSSKVWLRNDGSLDFPVGTIATKTFFYPQLEGSSPEEVSLPSDLHKAHQSGTRLPLENMRLIETRVMVKDSKGEWLAFPYVWNKEQNQAFYTPTGEIKNLSIQLHDEGDQQESFHYLVPDVHQCGGCHALDHASRKLRPIGLHYRNLAQKGPQDAPRYPTIVTAKNSGLLQGWVESDLLAFRLHAQPQNLPVLVPWQNTDLSLEERARSYLDVNCAHCHSPKGPAGTSGLFLGIDEKILQHLGYCKPSVAAGRGSGGNTFSIVPGHPDKSILAFRMNDRDPGIMMPELGRSLVHKEGVKLIRQWISELEGTCQG